MIVLSVVIAIIWIGFTVYMRVRNPILVLAAAGAVYALLSVLLAAILQVLFPGTIGEAPVYLSLLLTAGLAGHKQHLGSFPRVGFPGHHEFKSALTLP